MTDLHHVDWSKLPQPMDDGEVEHLHGMQVPAISLPATSGKLVDLSEIRGPVILFVYPMTGRPDRALPENWDAVPGARGCTPQACAFRDLYKDLLDAGAEAVFGVSTQSSDYQAEAAARLHLPYDLLSDNYRLLGERMRLPSFEVSGKSYYSRLTLVVQEQLVRKVFYPVFPPDENPAAVLSWLKSNVG